MLKNNNQFNIINSQKFVKKQFVRSLGSIILCGSIFTVFFGEAFAKTINQDLTQRDIGARVTQPSKLLIANTAGKVRWRLNKRGARFRKLTPAGQATFDRFQNAIANKGMNPVDAARLAGDTQYKRLQGNQYQIRLSQKDRATFKIDRANHVVIILQVGGHT